MRKAFLLLASLLAANSLTAAQAPPVETLVAEALSANPRVRELELLIKESGTLEQPAATLPDPMVDVMVANLGFPRPKLGSEVMASVSLRQALSYPGKLRLRRQLVEAETLVRRSELEALKAWLTVEVRKTYAQVFAIDSELATLAEAEKTLDVLQETATQRYRAGMATQEAVVKVVLQRARLQERETDLFRQRVEAVAQLNRLLNRPLDTPLGRVTQIPEELVLPSDWPLQALQHAPALAVAHAAVAAAGSAVAVAERDLKPNLFASTSVATGGVRGGEATLGVGLEWPFWKKTKQLPLLTATRLRLEATRARRDEVAAEIREAVEKTQAAWQTAEEQLRRYREELLPFSRAALEAARAAFLTGQGDFSTVIEDFNLWLAAQVGLAQRQAQRFIAWAEAQAMLAQPGGDL